MIVTYLGEFDRNALEKAVALLQQILETSCDEFYPAGFRIAWDTSTDKVYTENFRGGIGAVNRYGNLEPLLFCGLCKRAGFADELNWCDKWECCGDCL